MMVSVIIPAYNSEKTISRTLDALADQSYPADSLEVIVVDDGSTDTTPDIIKCYLVSYIHQENQGPATARNRGVKEATGEIVLFTDADCVPDTNWVREMVSSFEDTEVVAVKGAYRTSQKTITARFSQIEFEERFEMLTKVESVDMIDTYSAGFRRDIFVKMGGFDTSFPVANNEDTELSYRMSQLNYKMVFNPKAIVAHLNHPDSIPRYARLKFSRGYWRMVVYKKFPGKMVKDTYTPQTLKLQILFLYLSVLLAVLTALWPPMKLPLICSLAAFLITAVPFTLFALKRDKTVGLFSPLLLILRAASLGAGMIWAIFSIITKIRTV